MAIYGYYPTHLQILEWLNRDGGVKVFCIAGTWYSRAGYMQPHQRHVSLVEAAVGVMPPVFELPGYEPPNK